MITAVFQNNDDYAHAYGLWQWDYGQQLRIEGLHLPTAVEIHFALQETGGEAIPRVGTTKDGVTTVTIPDSMLEGNGTAWTAEKAYSIYAWVYLSDKSSGETIKRITMQVKSRPKPEAFEAPGDGEIFHEAIEAVNDAAKRAEEAGDKAVSAADEAKAAATQAAEHLQATEGLAEQVETNADTVAQDKQAVAGMLSQTQQVASDAALSAQEAKLSETAAVQAQTGAEAAEDTARQYAEETEADRQAVANDKQTVTQMREAVAADRKAVEQTALQFGQTSQDALTAIGQAQSTAVGAVKAEGNKQTTAVQEVGTQAVSKVAEAKTIAVEAVTTEGDKQTKRVEDAAAGIVADREQIGQNKTDIAGLVEGMTDLAPAILNTASGSFITANDAAEGRTFRGLRVFGRTEQVRTRGIQLLRNDIKGINTYGGVTIELKDCIVSIRGTFEANLEKRPVLEVPLNRDDFVGKTISNVSDDPNLFLRFRADYADGRIDYNIIDLAVDENVKKIWARYFYREKNPSAGTKVNETHKVMLCETKVKALPWEPYTGGKPSPSPEYQQEMDVVGESGSIKMAVMGQNLLKPNNRNVFCALHLRANTTITLMTNGRPSEGGDIKFVGADGSDIWFSIDKGQTRVCRPIKNDVKGFYDLLEPSAGLNYMLAVGDVQDYKPYIDPHPLTLTTPNGLPGIPVSKDGNYMDADGQQWICDEADLGRGKYVQRVTEYTLDPNNDNIFTVDKNAIHKKSILIEIKVNNASSYNALKGHYMLCNGLKACTKEDAMYTIDEVSCGYTSGDKFLHARLPIEAGETKESVKAYLMKLPYMLKFLYILSTPIERDLSPEEIAAYKALRTYSPTTVISNDAGAGMEVTYVADTKTYIDNKFAALNKAVLDAVGGI